MSIKIPKPSVSEQIPSGTYIARCYSMIHIGTTSFEWQGQVKKTNKVRVTFELPTELKVFKEGETARPWVISQEYSLSLHEKSKLRPILESWRGKKFTDIELEEFDVVNLIGVPAMISVIHNEKGYAEVASIAKLPKGTECPPQMNPPQILDYNDNWSEDVFSKLPEFLQAKIRSSEEYQKMKGLAVEGISEPDIDPNDIPF